MDTYRPAVSGCGESVRNGNQEPVHSARESPPIAQVEGRLEATDVFVPGGTPTRRPQAVSE